LPVYFLTCSISDKDTVAYRRDRVGSGIRTGSGRCLGGVGGKGDCANEAPAVDAEPPDRRPQTLQDRRLSPGKTENPGLHGHQTSLRIPLYAFLFFAAICIATCFIILPPTVAPAAFVLFSKGFSGTLA